MSANKFFTLVFILLTIFISEKVIGQTVPYLEQKITLHASNKQPSEILKMIEAQKKFNFSYDPRIMENQKPQSIDVKDVPVRSVLDEVFDGKVSYKEKGRYIILSSAPAKAASNENAYFIVTGYVKDGIDGTTVAEASIVDKKSRESAISNQYGYFNLRINNKQRDELLQLTIYKQNYKDTIVYIKQTGTSIVNLSIYPEVKEAPVDSAAIRDSLLTVDQLSFINMILSDEAKSNTKNVDDTLHSPFQVSFLPFLGTNLKLSGNTVNDYSLNILAGYSMGTRVLEIGGLVNINRDSVKSVQIAGLSNVTGGPVSGLQLAGLVNFNMKEVSGCQIAGLINNNLDTSHAVQVAGLLNVNIKKSNAPMIAGLMNVTVADAKGVHIAGLMNVCPKTFEGVQVAGLVNYAAKIKGSQVGFLNIADSCTGVPVGFMSLVQSGYHQLEISTDEVFPFNASFRTGVRSFYNIFNAGIKKLGEPDNIWYFGYGVGSAIRLGKSWDLNLDLTVNQPLAGNRLENFNPLTKLNITAEKRFSKNFAIAVGPVLNYYWVNTTDPDFDDVLSTIPPDNVISTDTKDEYVGSFWIGGKLAIRFF